MENEFGKLKEMLSNVKIPLYTADEVAILMSDFHDQIMGSEPQMETLKAACTYIIANQENFEKMRELKSVLQSA